MTWRTLYFTFISFNNHLTITEIVFRKLWQINFSNSKVNDRKFLKIRNYGNFWITFIILNCGVHFIFVDAKSWTLGKCAKTILNEILYKYLGNQRWGRAHFHSRKLTFTLSSRFLSSLIILSLSLASEFNIKREREAAVRRCSSK